MLRHVQEEQTNVIEIQVRRNCEALKFEQSLYRTDVTSQVYRCGPSGPFLCLVSSGVPYLGDSKFIFILFGSIPLRGKGVRASLGVHQT